MVPPAPGRFSTITGWPNPSERICAVIRASASAGPPGANPTSSLIGRSGNACAPAPLLASANAIAASAVQTANLRVSPWFTSDSVL